MTNFTQSLIWISYRLLMTGQDHKYDEDVHKAPVILFIS